MVAPVGLEPTRVAPMDFESIVSTIPPRSHNLFGTWLTRATSPRVEYEKRGILQKRLLKKIPSVFEAIKNIFFIL